MLIGPKGEQRPTNSIEAGIVAATVGVGDIDEEYPDKPASKPKRAKGGKARAEALTPERRSEIAAHAANSRWTDGDRKEPNPA